MRSFWVLLALLFSTPTIHTHVASPLVAPVPLTKLAPLNLSVAADTPPPGSNPVFEVLGPTLSAACGEAGLLVVLVPAALTSVPIPPQVLTLFGPVIQLCGAVPNGQGGYTCTLDTTASMELSMLAPSVASTLLTLLPPPFGVIMNQTLVIQDTVPGGSSLPLASTVAGILMCAVPPAKAKTPTPATTLAPPDTIAAPPDTAIGVTSPDVLPAEPTVDTTAPTVTAAPAPVPTPLPQVAAPIVATNGGFQYVAVLLVPLLVLVGVGFLINAFTRPLAVRDGASRRSS